MWSLHLTGDYTTPVPQHSDKPVLHRSFTVRSIFHGDKCEWKRTPKLVLAVARQKEIFRESDISSDLISLDDISGYFCGSAAEYPESIGGLSSATSS